MLSPSQQESLDWLQTTKRTPSEEEEYQILKSHQEMKDEPELGYEGGEDENMTLGKAVEILASGGTQADYVKATRLGREALERILATRLVRKGTVVPLPSETTE